jgi:hypothetical protein
MDRGDQTADDGSFESIMRGFRGRPGDWPSLPVDEVVGEGLRTTRRLIAAAGGELVDLRSGRGVLETKSTVYKVIEDGPCDDMLVLDVALVGANAFERGKGLCIVAPSLSDELLLKILALGQAHYFSFKGLGVTVCTSEMQIAHAVAAADGVGARKPAHVDDSVYWRATLKVVFWIFVGTAFYVTIRHLYPQAYVDLLAVLPFWLKAFYGERIPGTRNGDIRSPIWRLVHTNAVMAPFLAVLLLPAVVLVPSLVPYLAAAAIAIDITAFISPAFARRFTLGITSLYGRRSA